jgi:hypothetical protein
MAFWLLEYLGGDENSFFGLVVLIFLTFVRCLVFESSSELIPLYGTNCFLFLPQSKSLARSEVSSVSDFLALFRASRHVSESVQYM